MTCRPRCKLRLRGDDVCEGITHARLQVDKDSSGNVVLVIRLIEKYIFAVAAFRSPFLQYAFVVDAVLRTQALPVHRTHLHDALDTLARSLNRCFSHSGSRIVPAGLSQFREA